MQHKGFFITIEGIDGSGKTTLIERCAKALKEIGKTVLTTKEPGGSVLGKDIRAILQEHPEPLNGKAAFLLFAADRAQHFANVIIPALQQGSVVLADRCADSSLAYQGYGHGVDRDMIRSVNRWVMSQTIPNLTLYLRLNPETATNRLIESRQNLTSFEQENRKFWERVIQGYEEIFAGRDNVGIIDANADAEAVFTQSWNRITQDMKLEI